MGEYRATACSIRIGLIRQQINSSQDSHFGIPFGGYKQSGIGRELGQYALSAYTQVKAVHGEFSFAIDIVMKLTGVCSQLGNMVVVHFILSRVDKSSHLRCKVEHPARVPKTIQGLPVDWQTDERQHITPRVWRLCVYILILDSIIVSERALLTVAEPNHISVLHLLRLRPLLRISLFCP